MKPLPVPFDRELETALAAFPYPSTITPGMLQTLRDQEEQATPDVRELVEGRDIEWEGIEIPRSDGTIINGTIFRPKGVKHATPGIVHTHGGGMAMGTQFTAWNIFLEWVDLGCTVVTFNYRLAPEHPYPAGIDDCYAALVWAAQESERLGIDPNRLAVGGPSAGGGLAAALALMARDRNGPALAAQILICPMLDDRNETVSSHQFSGIGIWDRASNLTGWGALLGDKRGTSEVSYYAAPGRATDLSSLPPTFIDVGSAEVFRDEDVSYASRIWEAGGVAELHVWPGAFHGFDSAIPEAELSRSARRARNSWIVRTLNIEM